MRPADLLTDAQMAAFVRSGFLVAQPAPDEPHGETGEAILELFAKDGDPDNDIYNLVPGLQQLFARDEVRGILTSLLGPDYRLQCHRHCHLLPAVGPDTPQPREQHHHQDGTARQFKGWNRPWRRWHRPRRLNVFYYPHDVRIEGGPTKVVSGSQYWSALSPNADQHTETLAVPAGTLAFTHYNLWHRGTTNRCDQPRIMVKFVFERCAEPAGPSWNGTPGYDGKEYSADEAAGDPGPHSRRSVWGWLCATSADGAPGSDAASLWEKATDPAETADTIEAAYELALHGGAAVDVAADAFADATEPTTRERAALVLSNVQGDAVSLLSDSLSADDEWMRATALDLLADIGLAGLDAATAAAASVDDDSPWVRHNLMQALEVWGPGAAELQELALRGLDDEEPHVCFNAMSALANMGTDADLLRARLQPMCAHPHHQVAWKASQLLAAVQ